MSRAGAELSRSGPGATDGGDRGRRSVPGPPTLPGSRAIVGGLLMAVAAVGTFVAWQRSADVPETPYLVAVRPLPPGHRITADDLRPALMAPHPGVAASAFSEPGALVGRVLLGPVGEGELVQAGQVGEAGDAGVVAEVSFALPRDRAVDGRLRSGDRVDVFVTEAGSTRIVLEHVVVIAAGEPDGSSAVAAGQAVATLGLDDPALRGDLVHALRVGEVTLVRSTYATEVGP